jgi:hypothetical protein
VIVRPFLVGVWFVVAALASGALLAALLLVDPEHAKPDRSESAVARITKYPGAGVDVGLIESQLFEAARAAEAEAENARRIEAEEASRLEAARGAPSSNMVGPGSGVASCGDDWGCFRECTIRIESGGDYSINTGNGHYGAWQFAMNTWPGAVTRAGYEEWAGRLPNEAPPSVQDAAAHQLWLERGTQPWGGRC